MTPLDKFKRRLVRDIARRRYQEKQSEDEMFEQLDTEYGCECKLLWDHITSLTLKKLKRLLAADDRADYITKIARMTTTEWLTFDLVLVHEKVDVIGEDMVETGKPEPTVHSLLFDLVKKHNIEGKVEQNVDPKILVKAWFTLTQEYNTGGRECSPMLLQRRWYQLKENTRSKLYDFWMNYKGNLRLYEKALSRKPTPLQILIAETYPDIITDPFEEWEDLIKKKKVMLASDFEIQRDKRKSNSDGEPDLIVIEPNVETIELVADSDNEEYNNDETDNSDTDSALVKEDNTIKDEPIDSIDIEESETIAGAVDFDIRLKNEISNLKQSEKEFETSPVENYILLPKITCIMGSVSLPGCNMEKNVPVFKHIRNIAENSIENPCDGDDDDVQIISELIKNESCPIDYDPAGNESILTDCDPVGNDSIPKDKGKLNSINNVEVTTDLGNDDSKIHKIDSIIPELPLDLQLVDDGIELIDDADYEQDITSCTVKKEENCENTEEYDTACRIDPKLIMFPVTYTKKIDDMDVFQNSSFLTVKGNDIIQRALVESKPVFKRAAEEKEFSEDNCDDASKPIRRLKYTNWRLQKLKNRSYNPIQLCKNPDFNTRLKKLTVGFFSSERNRLLFSACKPLTIDLHKGFEDSLVDNTLYLERTDSPTVKKENNIVVCKNTASVIPSALAMQSLIDNSKLKVQELLKTKEENLENETQEQHKPKMEKIEEQIPTNSVLVERNKMVKLPNIEEIRHQNLLVAEVSPMLPQYNAQDSTPPVQLVSPAKSTSPQNVSIKSDATSNEYNTVGEPKTDSRPINIVYNDQKKRFVKRKTNNIPKLKPTHTLPAWSQPTTYGPVRDGSLITSDTLHKMLCLLSGTEVPSKCKYGFKKKRQKGNENELGEKEKNKAIPKNPTSTAKVDAVVENDKIDLTKDSLRIGIKRRGKKVKTVSSKSGYCCWAQYRLNSVSTDPKLRHLCPKPFCKCCCRNRLVDKMLYEQGASEGGKVVKIGNILVQNDYPVDGQNITTDGVSSNNGALQQFDGQNNIESIEITPSSTLIKVATVDEINKSFVHSISPHLPTDTVSKAVTLQSETSAEEDIQAVNAISCTDVESPKEVRQGIPLIKTRVVSGSWITKRMDAIEEAEKSVTVEAAQSQSDTMNTVSSKSVYCCWARYRLDSASTDPKLRHLCAKPLCKCCCRNRLVDRMLYEQGSSEVGKIVKIGNTLVQNDYPADDQNVTPDGVSSNNGTLHQFGGQNNIGSIEITPSSTLIKVAMVNEINKSFVHSIDPHLPEDTALKAVTLHSETSVEEDIQAVNAITCTGSESPKQVLQGIPLLKPRVVSGSWVTKRMDAIEETEKSVTVEAAQSQSNTVNSQHNNTEPIIVIDEDETPRELENKLTTAEQILPKGVSIVLLPDKRVSIAIDPNVRVDPEELVKVPEILLSVQKYFAGAVMNNPPQNDNNCVVDLNLNTTEVIPKNNLNDIEAIAANESVDQKTVTNVVQDSDITDVGFNITVRQSEDVGNDIVNESADDSQQSNMYPLILKSNEQIVESTHSYFNENVIQAEIHNHPPKCQDDTAVELDETRQNTNRTTILSDLMAMSGISQEDSAVPLKDPIPSVSLIPSTSSTIINYSLVKAANLKNARVVRKGKRIKKVIVSIRKKTNQNAPILSDAIIDLTDDCNNSKAAEKTNNQDNDEEFNDKLPNNTFRNSYNVEPPVRTLCTLNKEVSIPYPETPRRLFKHPPGLKKYSRPVMPFKIVSSNNTSICNFDKEVGLRSYKIFEKKNDTKTKQKSLLISKNNHRCSNEDSENDSSDDEPIAKKMRRIRGTMQPKQSDNEIGSKVDIVVPIETYNIPVEFSVEPEIKNESNNVDIEPKTS